MVTPPVPGAGPLPIPGPAIEDRGVSRHESILAPRWSARGLVKVARDATVGDADLRGTVAVGGSLTASTLYLDGRLEVDGSVEVQGPARARGELRAGRVVRAAELDLRGRLDAAESIVSGGRVAVVGALRSRSVAAREAVVDGFVEVPGTVAAGRIELALTDGSRLGALEAEEVRLSGPRPSLVGRVLGHAHEVRVGRVEAARAHLEGVEVAFVRAREITLGPDGHVAIVEGTIVARHPSSHVGPESRTPPPYGLRR